MLVIPDWHGSGTELKPGSSVSEIEKKAGDRSVSPQQHCNEYTVYESTVQRAQQPILRYMYVASHLCLARSSSRVFSVSSANMSNRATSDQEEVTWRSVEVKVWRVESEERRSTQMAALHLARKSGNWGLSQSTWVSPLDNS